MGLVSILEELFTEFFLLLQKASKLVPHYHKMISECTIDMEYAKECEEVIVKWGDYGKRIKDIRAVIAKFPLNDLVENKNYDISSCPYGFEE